jgi:hypothetical protein
VPAFRTDLSGFPQLVPEEPAPPAPPAQQEAEPEPKPMAAARKRKPAARKPAGKRKEG